MFYFDCLIDNVEVVAVCASHLFLSNYNINQIIKENLKRRQIVYQKYLSPSNTNQVTIQLTYQYSRHHGEPS